MKTIHILLPILLACSTAFGSNYDSERRDWAVVNLSANYMRNEADYCSGMETQALMGTVVKVLEKNGYWVRIEAPDGYRAWTTDLGLSFKTEDEAGEWIRSPKWICTAEYTHIYRNPSTDSQALSDLTMGGIVAKGSDKNGKWLEVKMPSGDSGWVPAADLSDYSEWCASRSHSADDIIALAKSFIGVPYLWGGCSVKGFDCSGLIQFCFYMNGIVLPRNSVDQIKTGDEVRPVLEDMQPGDLVFFGSGKPSHVALYIGDGKIIHSSHLVRINSLEVGRTDSYTRSILAVRRINGKKSLYLQNHLQ